MSTMFLSGSNILMVRMKLYFVYRESQNFKGDFLCTALFENGWVAFEHICSSPGLAPYDLWLNKKDRQEALHKMGIEVEPQDDLLIHDRDMPTKYPDLLARFQALNQDHWNDLYKKASGDDSSQEASVTLTFVRTKEDGTTEDIEVKMRG